MEAEPVWKTRVVEVEVASEPTRAARIGCAVLYGSPVGGSPWQQARGLRWRYRVFEAGAVIVLELMWSNARGVYRRELLAGVVCGAHMDPVPCVSPGLEVVLRTSGKQRLTFARGYMDLCSKAGFIPRVELHRQAHQWLKAGRDPALLVQHHLAKACAQEVG